MPNLINIIVPLEIFYRDSFNLLQQYNLHLYLEKLKGTKATLLKIEQEDDLLKNIDTHYQALYITSLPFDKTKQDSIYDDDFCIHAIEVLGGRSTTTELEHLSQRIISKTPDKVLQTFMNKLGKQLQNDEAYGMGVEPATSAFHKKVFYHKEAIRGKILWQDFNRKLMPTTIAPAS